MDKSVKESITILQETFDDFNDLANDTGNAGLAIIAAIGKTNLNVLIERIEYLENELTLKG